MNPPAPRPLAETDPETSVSSTTTDELANVPISPPTVESASKWTSTSEFSISTSPPSAEPMRPPRKEVDSIVSVDVTSTLLIVMSPMAFPTKPPAPEAAAVPSHSTFRFEMTAPEPVLNNPAPSPPPSNVEYSPLIV